MRKSVLNKTSRFCFALFALVAIVAGSLISGCGTGTASGGNNNNGNNTGGPPAGQNPTLAFVIGRIIDNTFTGAGVANATVTVNGTAITARTDSSGNFTLANVPLTATQFKVSSPDPLAYYNFATYNGLQYDTIVCNLPLPTLVQGANNLPGNVRMFVAGNNPPPPPPVGGCP